MSDFVDAKAAAAAAAKAADDAVANIKTAAEAATSAVEWSQITEAAAARVEAAVASGDMGAVAIAMALVIAGGARTISNAATATAANTAAVSLAAVVVANGATTVAAAVSETQSSSAQTHGAMMVSAAASFFTASYAAAASARGARAVVLHTFNAIFLGASVAATATAISVDYAKSKRDNELAMQTVKILLLGLLAASLITSAIASTSNIMDTIAQISVGFIVTAVFTYLALCFRK